tara:strand:+ start:302 stop:628 length:327 start_codon:yes stop_codon:yes gene_type:complete
MWIGDNEGWLSIVKHKEKQNCLLVRSRNREHIENIFPDAEIYVNLNADYPYRSDISIINVCLTIATRILEIDYYNFKNSVKEKKYARYLNKAWGVMYDYGLKFRTSSK